MFKDGEIIVIGAPYANNLGERSGVVYVYLREDNNWQKQATILGEYLKSQEEFGFYVTLNQSMLIVGCVHNKARGYDTGAVYTFMPLHGAAVLGGQSPPPIYSAVLGGVERINNG
ncbi:MAG: hypothetical protein F6K10_21295 [Moorea sp. SIO2B7]|nr:hypothetical protein [Moorena sp. SIO2B7]